MVTEYRGTIESESNNVGKHTVHLICIQFVIVSYPYPTLVAILVAPIDNS